MVAYKDEKRGTWFVSFHYNDWTGKNCRKVKRGFKTRREAVEWEQHFLMKEGSDLDMTFSEFVAAYTRDMQPKLKHNTWLTKEHIVRTKLSKGAKQQVSDVYERFLNPDINAMNKLLNRIENEKNKAIEKNLNHYTKIGLESAKRFEQCFNRFDRPIIGVYHEDNHTFETAGSDPIRF